MRGTISQINYLHSNPYLKVSYVGTQTKTHSDYRGVTGISVKVMAQQSHHQFNDTPHHGLRDTHIAHNARSPEPHTRDQSAG